MKTPDVEPLQFERFWHEQMHTMGEALDLSRAEIDALRRLTDRARLGPPGYTPSDDPQPARLGGIPRDV